MKPYSALFGALKVVDEVTVGIEAALPGAARSPCRAARRARARSAWARSRADATTSPSSRPGSRVAAAWGVEILGALLWIS